MQLYYIKSYLVTYKNDFATTKSQPSFETLGKTFGNSSDISFNLNTS